MTRPASSVGGATSGDWTTDGFVLVSDIHVSDQRLNIKAQAPVDLGQIGRFQLLAESPKSKKEDTAANSRLRRLARGESVPEQVDARSCRKIFLTAQDSSCGTGSRATGNLVFRDGSERQRSSTCRFSPEIPGDPWIRLRERRASSESDRRDREYGNALSKCARIRPVRATARRELILQHDPRFSEPARIAKYQGTVTLGLDRERGRVSNECPHFSPLGCGLDAKAVQAVEGWKFKPARKKASPVAAEIAVEVDFHLY